MASPTDKNAPSEPPGEENSALPEAPGAIEEEAAAGGTAAEAAVAEAVAAEKETEPWYTLDPLPSLDQILPEHIAYVRTVVARFSVTPTHWREDLVQEILIEAHRSRESRLDVRALLFGITRHVVFKWMAKRDAERTAVALHPGRDPVTNRSVEDDWQEAERREAVRAAIDELPDIFREVFVRSELEHMTMPEVARELGIPVNTGYTRLHLARARFLESLQRFLARRRIQKQDLSVPVGIGAAGATGATGPSPDPLLPVAGRAGAATKGGFGASVPWIGGGLVGATAVAVLVWIARSQGDGPSETAPTPEPPAAAPDSTPESSTQPGTSSGDAAVPEVSVQPPPPAPIPIAPRPDSSEPASLPTGDEAPDLGKSGEGLAARAVMGLVKAGKREEAIKAAEAFRKNHPNSIYIQNINQLLAAAPPPSSPPPPPKDSQR